MSGLALPFSSAIFEASLVNLCEFCAIAPPSTALHLWGRTVAVGAHHESLTRHVSFARAADAGCLVGFDMALGQLFWHEWSAASKLSPLGGALGRFLRLPFVGQAQVRLEASPFQDCMPDFREQFRHPHRVGLQAAACSSFRCGGFGRRVSDCWVFLIPAVFEEGGKHMIPPMVEEQIEEDIRRGRMLRMPHLEAVATYGSLTGSQIRLVHDGTHGLRVNRNIRQPNELEFPRLGDLEEVVRVFKTEAETLSRRMAMVIGFKSAHRLVPIQFQDGGLQGS